MLAGLFKAPSRFAPHINLPAARARANVVLDNLVEAGFMTEGQVFGARRNPAVAIDRRDENAPNYYLDWAFDEMKKLVDKFPKNDHRAHVRRAHCARHESAARHREVRWRIRSSSTAATTTRSRARWCWPISTARCAPWSAGATTRVSQFNRATDAHAPARLVVQALRLCHRADERLHADTRSSSTARSASATGARRTTAAPIRGSVTLTDRRSPGRSTPSRCGCRSLLGKGSAERCPRRPRYDRRDGAQDGHHAARCPTPRRCRSAPTKWSVLDHTVAYATFPNKGDGGHAARDPRKCAPAAGDTIWRFDRDGPKPRRVHH